MINGITRLTGVYHAKGSLTGELAYVVGKVLGTAHCALCDITHGAVREKASWRRCREALAVPFETVHLDDRSPELVATTEGRTPCVVAHLADGSIEMLIDAAGLDACAGDPDALAEAIRAALDARAEP